MEKLVTNVCILGAGPAGATTSLFLSKFMVPHTIVDAAVFPRDKVCGDALDLKVMWVLNNLDTSIIENEMMNNPDFSKARGISIIVSKNKKNKFCVDSIQSAEQYPHFFVTKRATFDNMLVKRISSPFADFRQETAVYKIERSENGWILFAKNGNRQIEIHTRLLIGADGDHSIFLRTLGERKVDRANYCAALRQYWKGVEGFDEDKNIEVYLPEHLPLGYFWMFPLANGEANIGCGLVSDYIAKGSINLREIFNDIITNDPVIKHRFKNAEPLEKPVGWGVPLASQRRNASGDNYLLVGDAAAIINPTTGEGIGPGMISGYVAAHFIKRAVENDNYSGEMFINYNREISRRLEGDIKYYNLMRKLSPLFFKFVIKHLSGTRYAQRYFKKNIVKWLSTTKTKKIHVDM